MSFLVYLPKKKGYEIMMEIKSIKDIINNNYEFLDMLKYSHYNPSNEKLSKISKKYSEDKNIYCLGNFYDDKMIGFIVIKYIDEFIYEIIDIAVSTEYRKLGIGSKMIDYIIENLPIKTLYAETDNDAIDFYKKYGFVINSINKFEETNRYKCTWSSN